MRTVIVRLFEPAPGAGSVDLHGFVEDISCGRRERFAGAEQLLAVFARIAAVGDEENAAAEVQ